MKECPNCGAEIPEGKRLCPNCGFDTAESQAERVKELREKGQIHPGRVGSTRSDEFSGPGPAENRPDETPPAEGPVDPREADAGL